MILRTINWKNGFIQSAAVIVIGVLIGLGGASAFERGRAHTADRVRAEVVRVIDGDTVVIRLLGGWTDRVRLAGIDAPERGEPGHDAATAFLADRVQGRTVVLVFEISGDGGPDRGRFGRVLARLEIDGVDVGAEMVRAGLAQVYRP